MRDLTLVRTAELPPGYMHMSFPTEEMPRFRRDLDRGRYWVAGTPRVHQGRVYVAVRRAPRQWLRPVAWTAAGATFVLALATVVKWMISLTDAVSDAGAALGYLLALSLVLLFVAWRRTR